MNKIIDYPLVFLSLVFCFLSVQSQPKYKYDLIIKNGTVIDSKNELNEVLDLAIKDQKIVAVEKNISATAAPKIIDAKGMYVCPGLIDIHSHNFHGTEADQYLSNSFTALPPDGFTFRNGITTIVDVGGAGWRNFKTFKTQTIDRSKTRVLSFLNIVGNGMRGGVYEQDLSDMNPKLTALVAKQYPGVIVGFKLAHYSGFDWTPTDRVIEAGNTANLPVMIDFGGSQPELSLEKLLLEKLRPGDIFTHTYAHVNGRISIVDKNGKLGAFVLKAQQKGIIMDVGHGGGSFDFEQAVPALAQGLKPNTISTDLHTGSMNGGMKNILNVMSKFLNLGLSLEEVVRANTWSAAQAIRQYHLGSLSPGNEADICILNLRNGNFGFVDTKGLKMSGTQKLECELTLRSGKVVFDLNGLASESWKK